MTDHCDIAIIGGGPVGTALALALRNNGLRINLFEAQQSATSKHDPRALALSYGSRLLLSRLGVWQTLTQISTIKSIHISQKNSFGRTLLNATDLNVPELGYVLPYPALQHALHNALSDSPVIMQQGATVTQLDPHSEGAVIHYEQESQTRQLSARLVVVADGGKLLASTYPPKSHDYGQSAIIAHVTSSLPKADTAFERFTPDGPMALLPYQNGYELVWTVAHTQVETMLQWSDAHLLSQLHQHFGDRLGEFLTVGTRSTFPLRLKRAPDLSLQHTVLIGNAAQTLHPVAGQGFNMGLRDAWELSQEILRHAPEALGTENMLAAYTQSRRLDRLAGIHFTDGLVKLFSNDLPLLGPARAATLSLLDCLPGMKNFVARRMMFGVNG